MESKIKMIQFDADEPITKLIGEISEEARKWCEKNECKDCFDDEKGTFNIQKIRECKKLPRLLKLFWEAKVKNIVAEWLLMLVKNE